MKKRKAPPKPRDGDGLPRTSSLTMSPCGLYHVRNNLACGNVPAAYRADRQYTRRANKRARASGYSDGRTMLAYLRELLERMKGLR